MKRVSASEDANLPFYELSRQSLNFKKLIFILTGVSDITTPLLILGLVLPSRQDVQANHASGRLELLNQVRARALRLAHDPVFGRAVPCRLVPSFTRDRVIDERGKRGHALQVSPAGLVDAEVAAGGDEAAGGAAAAGARRAAARRRAGRHVQRRRVLQPGGDGQVGGRDSDHGDSEEGQDAAEDQRGYGDERAVQRGLQVHGAGGGGKSEEAGARAGTEIVHGNEMHRCGYVGERGAGEVKFKAL